MKFVSLLNDILYYMHRTNVHKHPLVSRVMCRYGRHDLECESITHEGVLLRCFYCGYEKFSFTPATHKA